MRQIAPYKLGGKADYLVGAETWDANAWTDYFIKYALPPSGFCEPVAGCLVAAQEKMKAAAPETDWKAGVEK